MEAVVAVRRGDAARAPAVRRAHRLGRRRALRRRAAPDRVLRLHGGGLRDLRLDVVGAVRQDLRCRAGPPAPRDPHLPEARREPVPRGADPDQGMQRRALRGPGLPDVRLVRVEHVLRALRRRHAVEGPRDHAHAGGRRSGLPRAAGRDPALPRAAVVRDRGLQDRRLELLEPVHGLVRRRQPHPPARDRPEARGGGPGVPRRGLHGGPAVQHPVLPQGLLRRPLRRVVRVVPVLRELRGRHDVPEQADRQDGQRVRQGARGEGPGGEVLQPRRAVRRVAGLPVRRLDLVERLLLHVQRREAAIQGHRAARPGRRDVLQGPAQADLALQPGARRAPRPGVPADARRGLPPQRLGVVEPVQRQVRRRLAHPLPAGRAAPPQQGRDVR
mmetsp:Transcript_97047/g.296605  ORF Transcript_97047/g.296605 Transcript_97047/m.296605 type:complete len:386 (-) Transcript_97047:350-1507(-)